MAQASSLKSAPLSLLLPGITLNTTPQDFRPIKDGYMLRFDGNDWIVGSRAAARDVRGGIVGWAKARALRAPCPLSARRAGMVGTLRFAHPTILRGR
ncbi:hypothetical protein ABID58_001081 [Bradyrhizobium sp. S3.2.6]